MLEIEGQKTHSEVLYLREESLNIFAVNVSIPLNNKVFHYVHMASFHCHVQGSPLIERRIQIAKHSFITGQHDIKV